MHSLASFATATTTTSSEDAFDIADFPAVDPLDSSYEIDPSTVPRPRSRSSTVMAFPAPPALSSLPGTARPSVSTDAGDEQVFEQLAQLGQRESVQGLGLFSGGGNEPTGASGGRSSRSSSVSESSTLSDKSFDASTLASSAANTSCGPRDVEEFPADLPLPSQAASWFATSPPTSTPRALPSSIDPVYAADSRGPVHPALAGLFEDLGASTTGQNGLARRPSPTATQYSARSSSLPSQRSRSSSRAAPSPSPSPREDVAPWVVSPPPPITDTTFVTSPELATQELEVLADEPLTPAPPRKDSIASEERSPKVPVSPAASFGKTLRRLSSFGLLKKRKSEAILRDSAGSGNGASSVEPQQPRTPLLSKRKSEAALSALLRSSQTASGADKENSSTRRPASPHPTQTPKLARRSVSTPKLAAKFAASAPSPRGEVPRPPLPTSPATFAGMSPTPPFASRQRTSSFSEGEQFGTGRLKKRLSTLFSSGGRATPDEAVPPVPPTPQEHVAGTKTRAPAPTGIDIARANNGVIKEVSEPSSACTLEIASPAHPASVFSEDLPSTSSPATSAFPTPSRPAFVVSAAQDKPLPVPLPTSPLSAPADQQGFMFPPMPDVAQDPRLSLYSFMRSTDDLAQQKPPTAVEQPATVFPSTRLVQERSSARQRAGEGRSSTTLAVEHALPWDRPPSPMAFPPQDIIAFPVRLQPELQGALPSTAPLSTSPSTLHSVASDEEREDESEDEYGSNTDDSDEDDKPLGVVVPGALTAQKSLRLTAAKKSRSERKAREAQDAARGEQRKAQPSRSKRREDPFELEHAAAMVSTPPTSFDGHAGGAPIASSSQTGALPRLVRPPLSPIASASTVTTVQSAGHDALLPQSDESLERRSGSDSMRRSPSTPLDPMVADSALTIDSPELERQALPRPARTPFSLPSPKRESRQPSRSRSRKPEGMNVATSAAPLASAPTEAPLRSPIALGAPPIPTFRPPPVPATSSSSMTHAAAPAFDRRPSLATRSSSSPTTSPAGTPSLSRRPSLHPDLHPSSAMKRQASSSSAVSSSAALSRSGTLSAGTRSRSTTLSNAHPPPPAAVETRVYVDATCEQFVRVSVTDKTLAGEVVAFAKAKGALAKDTPGMVEGGWALWEAWRSTGIGASVSAAPFECFADDSASCAERPVREYELIADVTKSWDQEGNALFFRRTTMWPILSAHVRASLSVYHALAADIARARRQARPHPPAPKSGAVQLEVKKGKWSKRFLTLKDGTLSYSKAEKVRSHRPSPPQSSADLDLEHVLRAQGKDATVLCQLSNFDVFLVSAEQANRLKAPKPFVFALKSRLTRAHFEETSEWCHFLATKTPEEAASWVKCITEAGVRFFSYALTAAED